MKYYKKICVIMVISLIITQFSQVENIAQIKSNDHNAIKYFHDKLSDMSFHWECTFGNSSCTRFVHSCFRIEDMFSGRIISAGRTNLTMRAVQFYKCMCNENFTLVTYDSPPVFSDRFFIVVGPVLVVVIDLMQNVSFPILAYDWKKYILDKTIHRDKPPYTIVVHLEKLILHVLSPVYVAVNGDLFYGVFARERSRDLLLSVNLTMLSNIAKEVYNQSENHGVSMKKLNEALFSSFYIVNSVSSYPTFHDGRIYMPLDNGTVCCFDMIENRTVWLREIGELIFSGISFWKNRLFFSTFNGKIICLNETDGRVLWVTDVGDYSLTPPLVNLGRLFLGMRGGYVLCINASTGEILYSSKSMDGPILNLGWHYCGILAMTESTVYCLDACTGEIEWTIYKQGLNGFIESLDYMISLGNFLLEPYTGSIFELPYDWKEVFIDDDYIYALHESGMFEIYTLPGRFKVFSCKEVNLKLKEVKDVPVIFDVKKGVHIDHVNVTVICNSSCVKVDIKNVTMRGSDKVIWIRIKAENVGAANIMVVFVVDNPFEVMYTIIRVTVRKMHMEYPAEENKLPYQILYTIALPSITVLGMAIAVYLIRRSRKI